MNTRHEPHPEPGDLTGEQTRRLRRIVAHCSPVNGYAVKTYDENNPTTADDVLDALDTLAFEYSRRVDDRDALATRLTNERETCARRHTNK